MFAIKAALAACNLGDRMKKLLFAAAILFAHSSSFAQIYNGQDLAKYAASYERVTDHRGKDIDWENANVFFGYVSGTYDTNSPKQYCPPLYVTLGQLSSIAASFIKAHPEKWTYSGNEIVKQSFEQAFPCKKTKK